jgi:hypothetical protein
MGAVTAAVAAGAITTAQAAELSQMVCTFLHAIETSDFDRRLQLLERRGPPGR